MAPLANHSLIYLDGDPSAYKRFKTHVVEVGVATLSGAVGALVAYAAIIAPDTYASSSLAALPTLAVLLLGIVHMLAGALVLLGLLVTRRDVAAEIHTEQFGWIGASAGWLGFGWCMWYFAEGSTVTVVLGAILGTVSALRAVFLVEIEDQARARLARPPEPGIVQ